MLKRLWWKIKKLLRLVKDRRNVSVYDKELLDKASKSATFEALNKSRGMPKEGSYKYKKML